VVAPFFAGRRELIDDRLEPIDRQLVSVEPPDRIPPRLPIDLCQIAQRSTRADETVAGGQAAHTRPGQMAPDVVAKTLELFVSWRIGFEKLLAQPERSKWQAHLPAQTPAREFGDLHAAAADIEEQSVRNRQASHRTGETVASFGQTADRLDSNSQLSLHPFSEEAAVGGVAHRGGRHRNDPL